MITLYHNPRCSKSRACLQLLEGQGLAITLVDYMHQPLSLERLKQFADQLGIKALVRSQETLYKELNLATAKEQTILRAIISHPQLLQRPIAIHKDRMLIARPPEKVLELIND
ncbi:MAG: arsenate reductase (glutaredoxin) [Tatlockia sp.]|nr:arsenate reductase (glutaredoxin) [Tatlockia sp.]